MTCDSLVSRLIRLTVYGLSEPYKRPRVSPSSPVPSGTFGTSGVLWPFGATMSLRRSSEHDAKSSVTIETLQSSFLIAHPPLIG